MAVQIQTKGSYFPVRAHATDAGADLISTEDVELLAGIRYLVKTGVSVKIPNGYVGLLVPRSSLSKRNILMTNSIGIIDSDYRGEIMASLLYRGVRSDDFVARGEVDKIRIDAGERIVQLLIVPIVLAEFIPFEGEWDDTERGSGGFGSTGT